MITTAAYVAASDRLLHDDVYYEVLKRVQSSDGTTTFDLSKDGVTMDIRITLRRDASVAYQKRLE